MEIGDYLTNVLSVSDLSSIHYYYLEISSTEAQPEHANVQEIEATWRKSGALVFADKSGVWLFANSGGAGPSLPPTASFDQAGYVNFLDNTLVILQKGVYEPSNTGKVPKPANTLSISHNSALSPASPIDSSPRNSQSLNAKAQAHNASVGVRESAAVYNPGKNEVASAEPMFSDRVVKERFISSVLATLSCHMCCESGFISLNARTLLLPSPKYHPFNEKNTQTAKEIRSDETFMILTLDVHLTSTGTLIIKAWPSLPVEFSCLISSGPGPSQPEHIIEGTMIFLAPSGRVGRYEGLAINELSGGTLSSLNTSLSLGDSMARWKTQCIRWLSKKGIRTKLLESSCWILVQICSQVNLMDSTDIGDDGLWTPQEKLVTVAWPAALCFQRAKFRTYDAAARSTYQDYDPLSFAEAWFADAANREALIDKKKKEQDAAAAAVKTQVEGDIRNLAPASYSPVALRRASIAGAVYPTPPDGIQPTIGATPSFDGTVSTPGHPNPQALPVEADSITVTKGEPEDSGSNLWEEPGIKREEPSSNLEFNESANDNLFGDMGGDLFGENDITDADFSFFDEPDVTVGAQTSEGSGENGFGDNRESNVVINSNTIDVNPTSNEPERSGVQPDVTMRDVSPEDQHGKKDAASIDDIGMLETSRIEARELTQSPEQKSPAKHPSPLLSPVNIFRRLSIAGVGLGAKAGSNAPGRTVSAFGRFDFDLSLSSFDKKYGAQGQFIYPAMPRISASNQTKVLPKTGYLDSRRRKQKSIIVNIINPTPEPSNVPHILERNEHGSQSDTGSPAYSHITSPTSDQDDTSNTTDDVPTIFTPSLKRKRGSEDFGDSRDADVEFISSLEEIETDRGALLQALGPLDLLDPNVLDGDPADWSLAKFLAIPEPFSFSNSVNDDEYIASAQVLAEQAISGTLELSNFLENGATRAGANICTDRQSPENVIQQNLATAVRSCFEQFAECTMSSIIDIQDMQTSGQPNWAQLRPMPNPRSLHISENAKPSAIFNLAPPHLEVRRAESKLAVLSSAIPFWENLGLAPCKGGKDVSAICIYPDGDGMKDNVDGFLDHTRSAYESSRLGSHERFSNADLENGHLAVDFGASSMLSVADHQAILVRIRETAAKLAGLLAAGSTTETNVVIYHIYDSETPELLVPICSAFHDLFRMYKDGLAEKKLPVRNELVLQLVPLRFVASPTSLVMPSPSEYARLALEVYDRCVDLNLGTSVPSVILEQPLPRNIDFKCVATPSASPLKENSVMHVAYAQSVDDRWITAGWTDSMGMRQMTASYCLGRRNAPLTTALTEVANEIWETTLEIISDYKVQWRIMIAKSGVMEASEIEFWKGLVATERNREQITLTLITVDTNPSLTLIPPPVSIPPNILATHSSVYTTPVSTPQPSMVSPEQSGNAGTPARDSGNINAPTPGESNAELRIDADATLVDVTDQTWGVVLSHRLNNSNSLLEFMPTLASGYLIKRSGAGQTDIPVIIEVNIVLHEIQGKVINHEVPIKTFEPLLREILGLYRGLATLARVRGVVDAAKDARPWHIAAVEKAVTALYMLM